MRADTKGKHIWSFPLEIDPWIVYNCLNNLGQDLNVPSASQNSVSLKYEQFWTAVKTIILFLPSKISLVKKSWSEIVFFNSRRVLQCSTQEGSVKLPFLCLLISCFDEFLLICKQTTEGLQLFSPGKFCVDYLEIVMLQFWFDS